jgi:very-short-patch-repair endonuclease
VRNRKLVVHQTTELLPADRTAIGPIAITSPARTLIDIAACVDATALELAAEDAFRRGLTSPKQLESRLDTLGGPGRRGCAQLRKLLRTRDVDTESRWEVRLEQALVRAGLPWPRRQYEIRAAGRFVARVDLAYPSYRVAVEYDGLRWHTGRAQMDRNAARDLALLTVGWRVVHVTKATIPDARRAVLSLLSAAAG